MKKVPIQKTIRPSTRIPEYWNVGKFFLPDWSHVPSGDNDDDNVDDENDGVGG